MPTQERFDSNLRVRAKRGGRGINVGIDLSGFDPAIAGLGQTQDRMGNLAPGFQRVMRILEEGEDFHFEALDGRYVDSGDLRESLTQSNATGAIREAHAQELVFGSSIFYAAFLRKPKRKPRRRGKQYGLTSRGKPIPQDEALVRSKKGSPSAVLVLTKDDRAEANKVLLDYVLGRMR